MIDSTRITPLNNKMSSTMNNKMSSTMTGSIRRRSTDSSNRATASSNQDPERNHSLSCKVSTSREGAGYCCCFKKRSAACKTCDDHHVGCGRFWFVVSLCAAAATVGIVVYYYTMTSEIKLAHRQFEALSDRVLADAVAVARQTRLGLIAAVSVVSNWYPDAATYPFVIVPGYEEMGEKIRNASNGNDISMTYCPIVHMNQQQEFEDWTYQYFFEGENPIYGKDEIVSTFGWGIYARNYSIPDASDGDQRYHDNMPTLRWNSSYPYMKIPALQFSDNKSAPRFIMYNLKIEESRGKTYDGILDCIKEKQAAGTFKQESCGAISVLYSSYKYSTRPTALMSLPVFPRNDPETVVGFVSSSFPFEDVLKNVFGPQDNGIDAILSANVGAFNSFTFHVNDGVAGSVDYGDLHPEDSPFEPHCTMLFEKDMFGGKNSTEYTLCLYAEDEYIETYATNNPLAATLFSVLVILITSVFFLIYDFAVRNEFSHKQKLLTAKRNYMRYISHEVRTPLNAVYMGLRVMQEEIASKLGFQSAEQLETDLYRKEKESEQLDQDFELFQLTQEVINSTETATNVLSDLLNYDKIENGEMQLELSIINFWSLVERTTQEFQLPATKKQLTLSLDLSSLMDQEQPNFGEECAPYTTTNSGPSRSKDAQSAKVVGDAMRMRTVLRNVISNAVKFTGEGGTISITASCCETSKPGDDDNEDTFELKNGSLVTYPLFGQLKLTVIDTGVGMSEEQLERLFNDGVQFNPGALQAGSGSGLGLYISKGIVKQHNGSLEASSDGFGHGTAMTLLLPLYRVPLTSDSFSEEASTSTLDTTPVMDMVMPTTSTASSSNEVTAATTTTTTTTTSNWELKPMRILVVDDVSSNRKLLGRLLKNAGHTFDEADDGDVCVDKVVASIEEGTPYHTVLLDYEMPRMNGPDCAKAIRDQGNKDVFIVGVTGNLLKDDVQYFLQHGANAVLGKPFRLPQLEELWKEHLIMP